MSPEQIAATLNEQRMGFVELIGLRFVSVSGQEVIAEVTIEPKHHQPYGIVHGGLYATLAETIASVGAAVAVMPEGKHAVGLENATSFLHACRGGTIRGVAKALAQGRRSHVWEVHISDERRMIAHSRIRMMILEADAEVAGKKVSVGG